MKRTLVAGAMTLLVPVGVWSLARPNPAASPVVESRFLPPQPRSAFGQAMREASRWRLRGQQAVNEVRETLQRSSPAAITDADGETWRLRQSRRDPGGYLHRARDAAERARRLARTPEEVYRSDLLLARLQCESGRHAVEFQIAQRVVALKPRDPRSLTVLRHAAWCNRRWRLEQWARARLTALGDGRGTPGEDEGAFGLHPRIAGEMMVS